MMKSLHRRAMLFALTIAALAPSGCRKPDALPNDPLLRKELTPDEYQLLSERDQQRYKNIVVRVPHSLGGVLLPKSSGAYPTIIDKTVHSGDTLTLMGLYNQALFETAHPRVKVEYTQFDMWSDNFRSVLAVAISAGT